MTNIRDYVVPANCIVLVNAYHINYDPVIFPNPATFSPMRWLRSDGTFNRKIRIKCYNSIFSGDLVSAAPTFGTGRRICVGQPLAR